MDLLQEINNRIRSESNRVWEKLYNLAYDSTVGLLKIYQRKALQLAKIAGASAYLQVLKTFRQHAILLFLAVFAAMLGAVSLAIIPVALVMVTEWTPQTKAWAFAAIGLAHILIIILSARHVFSEERWMKASGIKKLLDSIHIGEE